MEANKDRPPYVVFETRAEEDRNASLEKGHYVSKDVDYAYVTPAGSKDRIERNVTEWFAMLEEQIREGRFPREWLSAYKEAYKAWKEDRELPETGYSIRNWPVVSPAQVKSLLDLHVRTVEDLAVANEETLNRLGMGARALKQRAVEFLENRGSDSSKTSAELEDLRQKLEILAERNKFLESRVEALLAQIPSDTDSASAPETTLTRL